MTDRYENIRKALEMGPTPGEWYWTDAYPTQDGRKTWSLIGDGGFGILSCDGEENSPQSVNTAAAELIAACDPDTIRELLAERDALVRDAKRYRWLRERIAGKEHVDEDFANNPGYSDGEVLAKEVDAAIDAAIAADDAQPQGEEVGRG